MVKNASVVTPKPIVAAPQNRSGFCNTMTCAPSWIMVGTSSTAAPKVIQKRHAGARYIMPSIGWKERP